MIIGMPPRFVYVTDESWIASERGGSVAGEPFAGSSQGILDSIARRTKRPETPQLRTAVCHSFEPRLNPACAIDSPIASPYDAESTKPHQRLAR